MKTKTMIVFMLALALSAQGQKYITKTGYIGFYSHTPVEDIKADNNQVSSILNSVTGELAFNVLIKGFEFEKALMQEHFNDNFMESNIYPSSTFKGQIDNLDAVDFEKEGEYNVNISGELTIHGVTRKIISKAVLNVKGKKLNAQSQIIVNPEDYNIKISEMVKEKIAKDIQVNIDIKYDLQKE